MIQSYQELISKLLPTIQLLCGPDHIEVNDTPLKHPFWRFTFQFPGSFNPAFLTLKIRNNLANLVNDGLIKSFEEKLAEKILLILNPKKYLDKSKIKISDDLITLKSKEYSLRALITETQTKLQGLLQIF